MKEVINFSNLLPKYQTFIFDIWGVIHDGVALYPGIKEVIDYLNNSKDHRALFLSNAPKSRDLVYLNLTKMGLEVNKSQIFTSGDYAINILKSQDIKYLPLGDLTDVNNHPLIIDKNTDNIEDADYILSTLYHSPGDDLEQYNDFFTEAIRRKKIMFCLNPDTEVVFLNKKKYCAGYFANIYSNLGGDVIYSGKPLVDIYEYLSKEVGGVVKDKTIMIGDTIETDVVGAKNFGIASALVLTGNSANLSKEFYGQPNFILKSLTIS